MLVNLNEILKIAEKRKIAIGAFNVTGLDTLVAEIEAAEELNEPIIIQHAEVHNVYNDIEIIGPVMVDLAKKASVPVCVQLDHGTSLTMIVKALEIGFSSIMYDGSHLPYKENLETTKKMAKLVHSYNASIEGELGRLVSNEDGKTSLLNPSDFYTIPEQAKEFVDVTKVDALAIAFGTNHGFYKEEPKLDFNIISKVRQLTNGLPLVMHGGSGVSTKDYKTEIANGIRKINFYSYMSKAGYDKVKEVIKDNQTNYLHDLIHEAKIAMKEIVKDTIKIFSNQ